MESPTLRAADLQNEDVVSVVVRLEALRSWGSEVNIGLKRNTKLNFQRPTKRSETWEPPLQLVDDYRGAVGEMLPNVRNVDSSVRATVLVGRNRFSGSYQTYLRIAQRMSGEKPVHVVQRQQL